MGSCPLKAGLAERDGNGTVAGAEPGDEGLPAPVRVQRRVGQHRAELLFQPLVGEVREELRGRGR